MFLLKIVILLVGIGVLVKMTDVVVSALKELASTLKVGKFAVSVVLLALTTSFPELSVGISAALDGQPNLSLGNVLGSNIANISLILGIAAMVGRSVPIVGEYLKKDFGYAFVAGALPLFLMADGSLSRVDGLILIFIYGYYLAGVFKKRHLRTLDDDRQTSHKIFTELKLVTSRKGRGSAARALLGIAVMLLAADVVVKMATQIASDLGVPVLLVGLLLVAVGTSLPELIVEIQAVRKREIAIMFGNLLGSTVANSTLIVGLTVLIHPIEIAAFDTYLIATLFYFLVFGMFWFFSRTKRRLDGWEGAVLVATYGLFVLAEFLKENGYGRWIREVMNGWGLG